MHVAPRIQPKLWVIPIIEPYSQNGPQTSTEVVKLVNATIAPQQSQAENSPPNPESLHHMKLCRETNGDLGENPTFKELKI